MRLLIYRGDRASASAFALRNALVANGVDAKVNRRGCTPRTRRTVINWGCSSSPYITGLNRSGVELAVDKLSTLRTLAAASVRVPEFTQHLHVDRGPDIWLARTKLNSHGGAGIVVVRRQDPIPEAPLYTRYVGKVQEYRLHVVDGKVIAEQQKRKELGTEQTADQKLIRNRSNGWVYAVNNVEWTDEPTKAAAYEEAEEAVLALGLDFGAVDLLIDKDAGLPYVLEVNTAPGLHSPTVLAAYVEAIKEMLDE